MTWFKVDDGFTEHPKLRALEANPREWAEAMAVWLAAGAYCARNLTDGFVDSGRLARATPLGRRALSVADRLVACGLWECVDGGYRFHDWADWQPTKAEILADRARKTEQRRGAAHARWDAARIAPSAAASHGTGDAPVPSRPVPSDPDQNSDRARSVEADAKRADLASLVRRAFAEAYEGLLAVPWADGAFGRQIAAVAAWAARAQDPEAVIRRAVAAFVADPWAREHRLPFGALAKDPGKYAGQAPPKRMSAEDLAEARRKIRVEYERRYQAAQGRDDGRRAAEDWREAQVAKLEGRAA